MVTELLTAKTSDPQFNYFLSRFEHNILPLLAGWGNNRPLASAGGCVHQSTNKRKSIEQKD
jgi:hypothetical protein